MSKRHDSEFLARRANILKRLDDAVQDYCAITDEHEQQIIDTTAFRQAGPHQQGKSACLELTLRCYPSGKIELKPHLHTPEAPKNKSELYNPPIAAPSVAAVVALLCLRGVKEAKKYVADE